MKMLIIVLALIREPLGVPIRESLNNSQPFGLSLCPVSPSVLTRQSTRTRLRRAGYLVR